MVGEKEERHLAYCKKCNQMTNHNKEGECLKCKGITVGWEYLFWNECEFAGDCVWNEKIADFGLINKIVKEVQEEEREKIKHINEINIQSLINEQVEIARKDERVKWIKGFTWFAWWKDGVQYVGNGRTTLKKAIEIVDKNMVEL